MPRCKYCNQLNKIEDCFQDPQYPSNQYCSKEHWKLHMKAKQEKQKINTSKTTNSTNQPKPKSDRVKLTDYIQDKWPVEPNWQWISRQIEDLCQENVLTYNDMRLVLKYCVDIKGLEVDGQYGLQQFIPKYVEEAIAFMDDLENIKSNISSIDFEDEFVHVPVGRVITHRALKEDVGF